MIDLLPPPPPEIVVTASRLAEEADQTPASVTLIDAKRIEALSPLLVADLLRLAPSVAVATSGPAGSQAQVRIRGAEANHTLLFIDGIRANDPAAGNEPRFELVNADLASRIEVVRGPQSALWGSEAVGGVVAVTGAEPGGHDLHGLAEAGSFGTRRAALSASVGTADRGLSLGFGGQRADGIDSFEGSGDKDGYRNLSGRIAAHFRLIPGLVVGGSGFALSARSDFDGYNPFTYEHDDTLDFTRSRLSAGRLFVELGKEPDGYARLSGSLLGSSNHNFLDQASVNRTRAGRRTVALEAGKAIGEQRIIVALDAERETFHARDDVYGGYTNQDRARDHQSVLAEWRGKISKLQAGLAIRHDIFSTFKDATTLRGSLLLPLSARVQLSATYGEGIAQPSFFDLYGYDPNSFVGNPSLKPERSRGGEVSWRYRSDRFDAALTGYVQRLRDEIVESPDFTTTLNADGTSRRKGMEFEAGWRFLADQRLSLTYAWLDATAPDSSGGRVTELRRPRHSGSIAADGTLGSWGYGASLAFVGRHRDRLDTYPYPVVSLDDYWLANLRLAYRLTSRVEGSIRLANALDQHYRDVAGYRTEGRSIHAGIRFNLGD